VNHDPFYIPPPEPTEVDKLRASVRQLARALSWVPTDDPRITCVVCHQEGCDIETRIRGTTDTSWVGMHSTCAKSETP